MSLAQKTEVLMINSRYWIALPILVSGLSLSVCWTKVEYEQVNPFRPITGVMYRLPATTLKLQATHEIISCDPLDIRFSDITLTPEFAPDPEIDAAYMLNHDELRSGLKIIESAKIELTGGMLKKVTYKAQDQTRETIKEGVNTGIKLALAASGVPIPIKA